MSLFKSIVRDVKKTNPFAFTLGEDDNLYEIREWVDTGCYALNAILSGDMFKGLPLGKRIALSGDKASGKSLIAMLLTKTFLETKKNSYAIFFETEGSTVVEMAKNAGIPEDKMIIIPVITVEDCKTQMLNILDKICESKLAKKEKKKAPKKKAPKKKAPKKKAPKKKAPKKAPEENFIFILDSLGMLGTEKETEDVKSGKTTKDMTRAGLIKGLSRLVTLKLSLTQSPFIIVNHNYKTMNKYMPEDMSGGSGVKFMSDVILYTFKAKQKSGTEQIGIIVRLKNDKSRFIKENKEIKLIISFKKGIYRYSHLQKFAEDLNIYKKDGNSFVLPDGRKEKMKDVRANPGKYFTKEIVKEIRDATKVDFEFGSSGFVDEGEELFEYVVEKDD